MAIEIRKAFEDLPRVQLKRGVGDPVKQSFRDDCDVNNIVSRFMKTGVLPEGSRLPPVFADVSGLDFRDMMDKVNAAQAAFDGLPALVRRRFNHDPQEFVEFCQDRSNQAELVKLGLAAERRKVVATSSVGNRREGDPKGRSEVLDGGDGAEPHKGLKSLKSKRSDLEGHEGSEG